MDEVKAAQKCYKQTRCNRIETRTGPARDKVRYLVQVRADRAAASTLRLGLEGLLSTPPVRYHRKRDLEVSPDQTTCTFTDNEKD